MCNDFWPRCISSRSFSHDFKIKQLKYGTKFCVQSKACTVLNVFLLYLTQMVSSMRGCVMCNNC